jgi:hypothetical protein
MGKIFLLIMLLTSQLAQGQVIEQSNTKLAQELFDYHTLKQKKNKTAAWILLSSGVAVTIAGFATLKNDGKKLFRNLLTGKDANAGASAFLIIGGGATTLASIPFFVSASKHERKATLSLKQEQNTAVMMVLNRRNYLVVSLKIDF